MRTIILITAILFTSKISAQHKIYVEVKDTIQIAYREYLGQEYIQDGFYYSREWKKDSVGIDSIRVTKIYYMLPHKPKKKVYLPQEFIEYISEPKGSFELNSY